MIPSDAFLKDETFFIIVSELLENSLQIATMELICFKSVVFSEINFIVDIFLEKFWRQRQLFYLLCFKAFGKGWKTPLNWLLWSSFPIKRLQEVLNNFCRNEFLCTDIFFETYWRQTQLFYLFCFKAFGEFLPADYSRALLF